jgi:hypothetical protein
MHKVHIPITIITCPQWHAKPPKAPPIIIGPSHKTIMHHTDSHHRELSNPRDESLAEAIRFAQDIQHFHQVTRGWNDTGQSFTITRAGHILQGRWYTVTAITHGHMVLSAHCAEKGKPGSNQNDQIGIEHEHLPGEEPTRVQLEASALLQAWYAGQYGRTSVLPAYGHKHFCNTACPDKNQGHIPQIIHMANNILKGV